MQTSSAVTASPSLPTPESISLPHYQSQEKQMNDRYEAIYEQKPRFNGDLYTPKYVRKQGAEKEGYCDICNGKWLQLKNSAFW